MYMFYIFVNMRQGARIKEICKEKDIILEELAKGLGIFRTSLSQALSQNSFSMDKIRDIADTLDVPAWQLFAYSDDVTDCNDFVAVLKCNGE